MYERGAEEQQVEDFVLEEQERGRWRMMYERSSRGVDGCMRGAVEDWVEDDVGEEKGEVEEQMDI